MALHHDRAHATARLLRKAPTIPERNLWTLIRNRQVANLRFRRQHPIGPYVVDFCCLRAKLIVELDGGVHDLREAEDALATTGFAGSGSSFCGSPTRLSRRDRTSFWMPLEIMPPTPVESPPIRPAPRPTFPRKGGRK
ncbi:endonuclease domain-containing protein [Brevundimonas sp.]|uniref:endonuclease domain-containing protein n=1 Tax=Brevundimonas sp. TaxID=1871086 RepID=UPI002E0D1F5A|nr:endonuclease domain-containing protein [Brevundimonas sp.]